MKKKHKEAEKNNKEGENLIFLISQPRAGSTLLQRILNGHPEIHTLAEPWIMLHPLYALKQEAIATEYVSSLAREALDDFLKDIPEGWELYIKALREMALVLYNRMRELSAKRFFLDKTPRYYYIIPELYHVFPKANFIILLRNPMAVLSSILITWMKNRPDLLLKNAHYSDVTKGPRYLINGIKQLKEDAIVVHYENLVAKPKDVVQHLCDRIGIPFYEDMLEYGLRKAPKGRFGDPVRVHKHKRPVSDYIDKWVQNLTSANLIDFAHEYLSILGPDVFAQMGYSYQETKNKLESKGVQDRVEEVSLVPSLPQPCELNRTKRGKFIRETVSNSDKYLISAIVSTYNSERFIRGCLEDLENQTIADKLEIVVVNSGSQQNEEAIVREFQQKHDNIKYIKTDERETMYRAWNRAIGIASGKYITNANTDDRHSPQMLERLAATLDTNDDVAVVYSQFYITTVENQTWQMRTSEKTAGWVRPYSREQLLNVYFLGPQPMWRKSLHDEYGYFDDSFRVCGDYEFFLRVSQTHNFMFIPEPLGLYLHSPKSLERTAGVKDREDRKIWSLYRNNTKKIIRRPFIPVRSFEGLTAINKLINLSDPIWSVFVRANEIETLLLDEIDGYLLSADEQEVDRYQHTFVRCLKEYLASPLRFRDAERIREFAQSIEVEDGVPWFVGLLQSLWHLKKGTVQAQVSESAKQAVAVLVSIYNELLFTELCLKSIRKLAGFEHYIVAVNNSTKDIRHFKEAVLKDGLVDQWFDSGCNNSGCNSHGDGLQRGLSLVRQFRYIAALDSDAVGLKENWLRDLVEQLNNKKAGLIGPQRVPGSNNIIESVVHPCCMIVDQERLGSEFQIDFTGQWPYWDVGGLLTWDCLLAGIPIVKVSHKYDGNSATHSSLINNSVRHYWYASRISVLDDTVQLDGYLVGDIRKRLAREYQSPELQEIRKYRVPGQISTAHKSKPQSPKLSVVLPAYNRPQLLTKVLGGFVEQTAAREDFEVIVVDDGSEPSLEQLVYQFRDRMNVVYLRQNNEGPCVARNRGIRAARGQIVLFSDDDDLPGPELIAEHLRSHQEYPDERIAVLGHLDWHWDLHVSPLMHYVTHIGGEYFGFDNLQDGRLYEVWKFWSGLVSAKRLLLARLQGPFDSRLHWGYEDIELACRLLPRNVKVLYNATAKKFILRSIDFEDFCRRRQKLGQALYYVATIHPDIIIPRYHLQDAANRYYSEYAPFLEEWSSKVIKFESLLSSQVQSGRPDIAGHIKSLFTVYHECFVGHWLKGYDEQMEASKGGKVSPSRPLDAQHKESPDNADLDCNQPSMPSVTEPLRITFINSNTPGFDVGSSNLRIFHVLKILVAAGHKIDHLYFNRYEDDERYKAAFDGTVNFINVLGTVNSFSDYLHFNKVAKLDCVWITNLWSVDYLNLAIQLTQWLKRNRPQTKVIIDTMDFHYKKFIRKFNISHEHEDLLEARCFLEAEKRLYPLADEVLTVTQVEKRDIIENIGSDCSVSVIPNIHRISAQAPDFQQRRQICFLGSFHISHNADAVKWFLNDVFPLIVEKAPEVEFHILGFNNGRFREELEVNPNVRVIGYVQDAELAVAGYRLFVCPMIYGAGMKGKLGLTAGVGTPIVTTTIGAEGFGFVDGQHCFIADAPEEFAQKCLRLLSETSLWNQFSREAKEMVAEKFSVRAVSQKIHALLRPVTRVGSAGEVTADSVNVPASSDHFLAPKAPARPKVSIITSCYNSARFLRQCLDSIRNQTMHQWELFLLDDGSTDDTRSIIEEYCRVDRRIKPYYFQNNQGPYLRRNFAIERANSDYIVIQDADDIMSPAKLEILYDEIARDDNLGVVGAFYRVFLDEFRGLQYTDGCELPLRHAKIAAEFSSWGHAMSHGSAIIRKDLFGAIGPYDENPFASDTFWFAKLGEYGKHYTGVRFKNIREYLTLIRIHASCQTHLLPTFDPRGRRMWYRQYCQCRLKQIRQKLEALPDTDIKTELRNCVCSDFLHRFEDHIIQMESEPLADDVIPELLGNSVRLFNKSFYVNSVNMLNAMEIMVPDIANRFRNYDLLRAMGLYAIDMKKQSLTYLSREIQNHNNAAAERFISDCFEGPRSTKRSQTGDLEQQSKIDVQKWCAENSDLYELQMVDTKMVPEVV